MYSAVILDGLYGSLRQHGASCIMAPDLKASIHLDAAYPEARVLQTHSTVELIPAAGRLIGSLRDMGYEFATAVADLVDNSIEAGASTVSVDIEFEGGDSWVRIADDGRGMAPAALREAMRYGSTRRYSDDDLGKFGLGLKVASLSQCRRLSIASRTGRDRAEIRAYCWDLEHIERTNRWELIPIPRQPEGPTLHDLLQGSNGTVVLWQRLDRILGYRDPDGEPARRRLAAMCREVEGHLAVVFHRYLSGEVRGRRLRIQVNGVEVHPWDPFARGERATKRLEPICIQLGQSDVRGQVTLEPFVLPHQADFSSPDTFRLASGPANWNQQQGFYVYRSHRMIQSGGWCRIRSVDEHTKLARVAFRFSPQLDDIFKVNVSKMRVELPAWIRDQIAAAISPVIRVANETYRRTGTAGLRTVRAIPIRARNSSPLKMKQAIRSLLSVANAAERDVIRRVANRLTGKGHDRA